ncbi:MAG: SDR family oxidoreductase [Pseudomonadota bacterium]
MTRIAVITGGAQGIGRGCAEHLLDAGWRVAALDLDAEAIADLRKERPDPSLLALEADVAQEDAVADAFARIAEWSGAGGLDLLFNNAGLSNPGAVPVEKLCLADWRRIVDSHLTAAFLCARAAIPALRRRRGAIVNMASTRAFQSEPDSEAYAAAKGGIVALTHALAISLGPDIRVNAVAPGWIETRDWAKRSARERPEHDALERSQHPVGRVGAPADIAAAVEYLASDRAGFVTGQTLVIDGGMQKRMIYEA